MQVFYTTSDLRRWYPKLLDNMLEFFELDISDNDRFMDLIGGDVFVCEALPDLESVVGLSRSEPLITGLNLSNGVPIFDVVHKFEQTEFYLFLLCTNNSGGNHFFIPFSLADKQPNVEKACEEHASSIP